MKILISVDIEGVAGVVDGEQTRAGNGEYERARLWMLEEANAAIEGAFAAGASEVYVSDAHGGFRNLPAGGVDARARLISGKPRPWGMLAGLDSGVDAVALVGYHSRAGGQGVLAHTINGFAFAEIVLNGQAVGEAALYGALAGERGIAVIFASGDDVFIAENRAFFPQAHWVETKQALGKFSAITLTPQASAARIRAGMAEALAAHRAAPFAVYCPPPPYHCRVRAGSSALADVFALMPGVVREDSMHVAFTQPDMGLVVRMLNSLSAMSASLR